MENSISTNSSICKSFWIFVFFIINVNNGIAQKNIKSTLQSFYEQHQFVKMDSLNSSHPKNKDYYFYKGVYANACNNPKLSNQYLDNLKRNPILKSLSFHRLKNDNYIKLFDYPNAYKSAQTIVKKFGQELSKQELKDQINNCLIWKILQKQSAQKIDPFKEVSVPSVKDLAGLITTNVVAQNAESNFVFDTGAGLNCITESNAKKMGIELISDQKIAVMSFTGQENNVPLGIAKELKIGGLTLYNSVFLVYPDSAFSFADGKYVINGIIGFPIIKDLGTIVFEKNQLTFKKDDIIKNEVKTLFVNELRAIVMLKYQGKLLPYNFDSGAKKSLFLKSFYELFEDEINKNGVVKSRKSSGAGAQEIEKEIIEIKSQEIWLGTEKIILPLMEVDKNNYGIYGKVNYGNVGQDILSQYKKIIISFDKNFLKLE